MISPCCTFETFRINNKKLGIEYDVCRKCGLPWAVTEEAWVDVKGFEDKYEVSNTGIVRSKYRSVRRNMNKMIYPQKVLAQTETAKGFHRVNLQFRGKHRNPSIRTLVAEHFVPNPNNYNYVEHITRNIKDNSYLNLKWVQFQPIPKQPRNLR